MTTNTNVNSEEVKSFIVSLLELADLNERSISRYTDEEAMKLFKIAFTHKSLDIDAAGNYELAELLGDGFINSIAVNYIVNYRFISKDGRRITNVGWISKIKTNLISKKGLATIGIKRGFGKFIQYNPEDRELVKFKDLKESERLKHTTYMSLIEDTVEAFIGTLVQIIDEKNDVVGPGYGVATRIVYKLFDEVTKGLTLKYREIWDPKSRLKELYDKNPELGPFTNRTFVSIPIMENDVSVGWKIRVFAQFKSRGKTTQMKIAEVNVRTNKVEAENKAAEKALVFLERRGIFDTPDDPYKRKQRGKKK